MANLLQKASIVLTPTAYDNGKVLCAKPSEPPYGDFDFSRNSAATRVNAQGLVENVQILSSNLVQNGDFSEEGAEEVSNGSFSQEGAELITNGSFDTDSNWTKVNATISGGTGNLDSTSGTSLLFQSALVVGKTYKAILDVTNYNGLGTCALINSNGDIQFEITSNGNKEFYFTQGGSSSNLSFRAINGGIFSIDNVSVREVGQDWSLGTGWSIGEDKAVAVSGTASKLRQTNTLNGKTCKVTLTVSDYSSGLLQVDFGSTSSASIIANGDYVFYGTYDQNNFEIYKSSDFIGSITNISVKEVGQNWSVSNSDANNYVEFGDGTARLKFLNVSPITQLMATAPYVSGKKYKLIVDVASVTSGSIKVANAGIDETFDTVGISTRIINPTGTSNIEFYRASADVDITLNSVSLIEITDDTSLPRINYEGFSYQDALGSELVTNGDFATDSDWSKGSGWSISGGTANTDGTPSSEIRQNNVTTVGKQYKYSFTISNSGGGVFNARLRNKSTGTPILNFSNEGTYSGTFTSNGTFIDFVTLSNNTASFSIDNVSVKEYLGQEVVPDSGCGSWLWEPQSTNLITQSELFSDAYWTKNGVSVLGGFTSPSGDLSAFKLVENTSSVHVIYNPSNAFSSLTDASYSIFVKYSGRQWVRLFCEFGTTSYNSWFDILNGVTGTSSADISDIQDYGNGWFKITQTNSLDAINGRYRLYLADADNSTTYTGDGVSGVYIWGAQAENQSYATSYIPTEGSTVTRNRDVCINGGSLASINSGSGTFFVDFKYLTDNDPANANWLGIESATGNSRVLFYKGATNNQRLLITNNLDVVFTNTSLFNIVKNQQYKLAVRYDSGNISVYLNGTEIDTSTNTYTSPIENLVTINLNESNQNLGCKLKSLVVWKEGLSDQELADLTYPTPTDPTFALDFDTIATDFTFARGSEATYVDAQGLIQSTNELGPELITNGDFATDAAWGKVNATISGGTGNLNGTGVTSMLYQDVLTNGSTYKATFTISNYNSIGNSDIINAGGAPIYVINSNGTFTITFTHTNASGNIYWRARNSAIFSIDNVSVKEYTTATNTPRLDYSTGAEAFLLEPQSTNLITQSELFSDASWTKQQITITQNATISPSGLIDASMISEDNTNNYHRIRRNISLSVDATLSIFAKKGTIDKFLLWSGSNGVGFDLTLGTINNVTSLNPPSSSSIKDFGNGWYRCSITDNSISAFEVFSLQDFSGFVYQGSSANNFYIWGAQLEEQSYATSYIPTSGTTVTRNQETCINATPEINSEEGVLYVEINAENVYSNSRYIALSNGTTSNRVIIGISSNSTGTITCFVSSGGSTVAILSSTADITDFNKVALRYRKNNFSLFLNGVKASTDTSGLPPVELNRLAYGNGVPNATPFYGSTKDIQVYTKALSDAELIKLTT